MKPPSNDFVVYLVIDNKQAPIKDLELDVYRDGTMYCILNIDDSWEPDLLLGENQMNWGSVRMSEEFIKNLDMTPYPEANIMVSCRASNRHGNIRVLIIENNVINPSSTTGGTRIRGHKVKVYFFDKIGRIRNFYINDYDRIAHEVMFLHQEETERADRFIDQAADDDADGLIVE